MTKYDTEKLADLWNSGASLGKIAFILGTTARHAAAAVSKRRKKNPGLFPLRYTERVANAGK